MGDASNAGSAGRERVEAQLRGPSYWRALEHLRETTSTNDAVAARARSGAAGGLVLVADHQTAGRGRRGRRWEDHPAGSLLASFLVGVPPRGTSLVPLATGLAVSDALRRHGVRADLKWPNDLLVGDRKCAGILVERHDDPAPGPFLVLGVGIDVDWRGTDRSGEAAGWTSLAEVTGTDVDRWSVLADLLRALAAWLDDVPRDPTRLLAAYRVRCRTLGRTVRVTTPGGEVYGTARDVEAGGALVVATAAGPVTVTAGDVTHVREPPAPPDRADVPSRRR
jgi:BirA family biotin operon repressor/biotin-[acetyl-CoA-carboxylase] ligase